jgi:threonine/homoserine/homoserine lactone efflux protein
VTDAGAVIADVVPLALAVAASPFAIIPAILLLLGPRPRLTAAGFLAGWALGVLAVTVAATLFADAVDRYGDPPGWAAWARIVLGLALLVLAARRWLTRDANAEQPAWLRALSEATPGTALRTGVLLSAANPKVALLAAAAGLAVGAAALGSRGTLAATAAFTALASLSVAAPLLLHLVAGPRALAPLQQSRAWLERHHVAVVSVVLAAIGVLLLVEGLRAL